MYRYRRPFSQDFILVVAATFGWLLWWWHLHNYQLPQGPLNSEHWGYLCWATATTLLGMFILYWLDYFRPFKKFKFIPDFFAFWVTQPISGLLCKPLVGIVFLVPFIRDREIFYGAFAPALVAVIVTGLGWWARGKSSAKSSVYLALTIGETDRFREIMQSEGWDKYFRVLNQDEFNGALATDGRVDYIIISRVATKNFISHQNILQAQVRGVMILDYRTLLNQMRGHISIHDTDIWTFLAGSVRQNSFIMIYRGFKFYLEPVVAAVGLVLLSPLFAVMAIIIKTTSPGPVFFHQRRTGYLGVEFDVVKFRSMRTDAEASGVRWATKSDSRVTPVGRFLRKTRIDELPQLWNVLTGEMSFLGPRPERPEFYEVISKQVPAFKLRLLVRPGISGWAQLLAGYAASIEESEKKLEFDLYYVQYMSPRMDLIILWRTILTLLRGDSGQ
jgi:lipopolysaccharide/colanic/teichoic acid biosynthesis glycosyltransferase